MISYYLKASTQIELESALDAAGLNTGDEGSPYYGQCGAFALEWIGEIFKPTGNTLDPGTEYERAEMASVGGFHCNVYSNELLPESLASFAIATPSAPSNMLAGS